MRRYYRLKYRGYRNKGGDTLMPLVKRNGNKFTIESTLEEEREKYLKIIREVQDLGEMEEVTRLQDEWREKKDKYAR